MLQCAVQKTKFFLKPGPLIGVGGNATPLYPRQRDPVPILQEAGWAPGPVWTGAGNLATTGIQWRTQEFCSGRGVVQLIQLRTGDRENGNLGGGSPLVRVSGGSCNLVQEISFHIVNFS
jgi:hypothetical protein